MALNKSAQVMIFLIIISFFISSTSHCMEQQKQEKTELNYKMLYKQKYLEEKRIVEEFKERERRANQSTLVFACMITYRTYSAKKKLTQSI